MDASTFEVVAIIVLVILSAVFSGMEIALVGQSAVKLRARIDAGEVLRTMLLRWHRSSDEVLATLLIGNNLVNILASALATDLTNRQFLDTPYAGWGIPIAVGVMTLLILVVGEVVPKTFARNHSEQYLKLLPLVRAADLLFLPIRKPLVWVTKKILRSDESEGPDTRVTEKDIEDLVHLGALDGALDAQSTRLMTGVLALDDKDARNIMVARTDVEMISADTPLPEVMTLIQAAGFSRYPVYGESVDQIVGVLYVKDLLTSMVVAGGIEHMEGLSAILRAPMVVPETMPVPDVLVAMKRQRVHLAVVASEYGGLAGIVTMEDIVEEVFGPIYDEHDTGNHEFTPQPDGSWLVDGTTTLRELDEELGIALTLEKDSDVETIAGLLMISSGGMPTVGFAHGQDGFNFEVVDAEPMRVIQVRIRKTGPEAAADATDIPSSTVDLGSIASGR